MFNVADETKLAAQEGFPAETAGNKSPEKHQDRHEHQDNTIKTAHFNKI
jgi:hypothetical protein